MKEAIESYLAEIATLWQAEKNISHEDVEKLQKKYALTSDDRAFLAQETQMNWLKGVNYSEHALWNDANRVLGIAANCDPFNGGVLHDWAWALIKRSEHEPESAEIEDRKLAENILLQALSIDPNDRTALDCMQYLNATYEQPSEVWVAEHEEAEKKRQEDSKQGTSERTSEKSSNKSDSKKKVNKGVSNFSSNEPELESLEPSEQMESVPEHDGASAATASSNPPKISAIRNRNFALFVGALVVLAIFVTIWRYRTPDVVTVVVPPVAPAPPTLPVAPIIPNPVGDVQIPVIFLSQDSNLKFDPTKSELNDYDTSFSYKLQGVMSSTAYEISKMRIRVDLVDVSGKVVQVEYDDVRDTYQPIGRPNDALPLDVLVYEKRVAPKLKEARVYVDQLVKEPALAAYPSEKPIVPIWESEHPAGIKFTVTERSKKTYTYSYDNGKTTAYLTISIQNTGTQALDRVQLKAEFCNAKDQVIGSTVNYVVSSASGPVLRPNDRAVYQFLTDLDAGNHAFDHYRIKVVEAE